MTLRIVELTGLAEQDRLADLFCRIWRADSPDQLVSPGMLRAFGHSGNYVVGAYRGSTLVGGGVAFLGAGHLHSHITGVVPGGQGQGVGYALKQHQRGWCLARGIGEVRWTFDPLVRRNAYFNLRKLGARPVAYLPDFYGRMSDGVNAGDASDRLYVSWPLESPDAVAAAATGGLAEPDTSGAVLLLDQAGPVPVAHGPAPPAAGSPGLVAVPADIESLRAADPQLAARWRLAVRDVLGGALSRGYAVTAFTRDGYYVVEQV